MEFNNEEKIVSKHSVSLKGSFLWGGSFKIIIFPFVPVSVLLSSKYIMEKDIWPSLVSRKTHPTRRIGTDLTGKNMLPHNISYLEKKQILI